MPLNLAIHDVQLVYLGISSSGSGPTLTISFDADWLALDDVGAVVDFVEQKKDAESRLFSDYPQNVQDAISALNTYAINRIKTAEGI